MRKLLTTALLLAFLNASAQHAISLAGEWAFGTGDEAVLSDRIVLPNSMITAGKGDPVTAQTRWTGSTYDSTYYFNPAMERYRQEADVKFPFFLTPRRHYVGTAWYERTVVVPRSWRHRPVVLFLERPHIETTVSVNGHEVGHRESLSVPHEYDITPYVRFGRANTIRIRVYNGIARRPVARQLRLSILNYMQGDRFQPTLRLEPQVVSNLFERTAPPVSMFTNESPDELKPALK